MSIRRTRKSMSLAAQTMALGVAAPQVIAHRVTRMALGGATPSVRDRKELYRMSSEKILAFNECWNAMALEAFKANQQLATSFMLSLWSPWALPMPSPKSASKQLDTLLDILGKGIAPIHRRAAANAKRLGRIKRR